ncbi:MAG: sugar ABC transporter ATP-binding protein [Planctomycetota bacterium]|jgi:simple sugar transport system ATP-binding protein
MAVRVNATESDPSAAPRLEMRGVTKAFPGVRALDDVDFALRAGEIHALMGGNGAGKTTLLKVLTGVHRADAGRILIDGRPVAPRSPAEALRLGVSTVYQEINLIPDLPIAENLFLGRQPARLGRIKWREIKRRAVTAVSRLGLSIDVARPLGSCSIALQQMVAIARAVDVAARILVLDEPTSSLDEREARQLFGVMRRLRGEGLGIIFVTHFIDQAYEVSDRITVLRNGRLVGSYDTPELPRLALIEKMIGRPLEEAAAATTEDQRAEVSSVETAFVAARGLGRKRAIAPLDLEIHRGEVVGLAGLLGSGRTETARLLFGLDRADSGEIRVHGTPTRLSSPRRAIARGFGYLPEDRQGQGLVADLSLRENIILALQAKRGWARTLTRRAQTEIADRYIRALGIDTPDAERPIRLLSGGNQQKAILARWLATEPALLILDEPTRGIDVGTKAELEKLIASLRQRGMAILFISSELEEVIRDSQRVIVLRDRRMVTELSGTDVTAGNVMRAIAGDQRS